MLYFVPNFGPGPFILALIISGALGLAAYMIVFRTRLFDHLINKPLVAPYIVVPNTVLALILAFMASSVWQNTSSAAAALQNEATALSRHKVIASTSPALSAELKSQLSAYTNLVQKVEWGSDYNAKRNPEVDQTLSDLYARSWAIDAGACSVREAG